MFSPYLHLKTFTMLALFVALVVVNVCVAKEELAASQLLEYVNEHNNPAGILRTSNGYPVTYKEANVGMERDSSILLSPYLLESLSSLSFERIPPRVVHAHGAGYKGYFEVTHDVSHITDIKHFNTIGKKTPILVRISTGAGQAGTLELKERGKGFAIKFYTEEGNMDLLGLTATVFGTKDPLAAVNFNHVVNPNPRTGLRDATVRWDFISKHPELLYSSIQTSSPAGQPRSYKNMKQHAIHTFQVENKHGVTGFARFSWFPVAGIQNFTNAELRTKMSQADYHSRELYDSISNGDYPSWTLCIQYVPKKDIAKAKYDLFDVTVEWLEIDYPYIPIGKLVLDKHVDNHFAEVEQAAYSPANLVPGIRGVDKIYEARSFLYRESQIYRLGTGYNNIKANCPLNRPLTYNRDGNAPVLDNGGDSPNYYPNSFNGIVPLNKTLSPLYRPDTDPRPTNLWQVAEYYYNLSEADRESLVANVGGSVAALPQPVKDNVMKIFEQVDSCFASSIQAVIASITASG